MSSDYGAIDLTHHIGSVQNYGGSAVAGDAFLQCFGLLVLVQGNYSFKCLDCNLVNHFHLFMFFCHPERNEITNRITAPAMNHLVQGDFHQNLIAEMTIENSMLKYLPTQLGN